MMRACTAVSVSDQSNISVHVTLQGSIYLGVAGCGMFYHRLGEALASGCVPRARLGNRDEVFLVSLPV